MPICFIFERTPTKILHARRAPNMYEEISTGSFEGHQGNDQGALRQSPSLPPRSIRPYNKAHSINVQAQ